MYRAVVSGGSRGSVEPLDFEKTEMEPLNFFLQLVELYRQYGFNILVLYPLGYAGNTSIQIPNDGPDLFPFPVI